MNVVVITVGIIGHLWMVLGWISLWAHLDDPRVKYLGRKITIHKEFFYPYVMVILFWVWMFVG